MAAIGVRDATTASQCDANPDAASSAYSDHDYHCDDGLKSTQAVFSDEVHSTYSSDDVRSTHSCETTNTQNSTTTANQRIMVCTFGVPDWLGWSAQYADKIKNHFHLRRAGVIRSKSQTRNRNTNVHISSAIAHSREHLKTSF
jgi:hypothetical protein